MAICLMVGDATAAGWRSANFRVYSGDYNGDGQPDLYLKAVTSVVVVGGEVATPIPLLPPLKNVVLLRNGASYSALYDPPAADLNAVAWTAAPYQSFIGDLNRDGILDLILQPNDSSDSLLIVSGNPSAHGVLQVASGTGLGTEIGYDVGARFALGDWLGNGGTSIRVSHPTQGQSTLFIDAGGQLVARYLSVPTPLPGVVLGKAAEAFTALNLLAPQAGVRGDGGVDYRYPLELPPGIAGLQPELALVQGGGAACWAKVGAWLGCRRSSVVRRASPRMGRTARSACWSRIAYAWMACACSCCPASTSSRAASIVPRSTASPESRPPAAPPRSVSKYALGTVGS
ncbi:FG-GAP repeat domain-containing protein [Pseudomonas aeruginosa]|uniref:FG-GAP repeat domain-containing protein n=1 Tax=Pseudomonas aeruginosa TaxID=287 RepID=UPI001F196711|nr:VCBS repeat-containing protein [Pseudomonas aeruginosa]